LSQTVDYLHFRSALDDLVSGVRSDPDSPASLEAVHVRLAAIVNSRGRLANAMDVAKHACNVVARDGDATRLIDLLEASRLRRVWFRKLGCRGFSFALVRRAAVRGRFNEHVTLRAALTTSTDLYYPPRIREALRGFRPLSDHSPGAICWVLGRADDISGERCWVLLNLQSDVTSSGPSCLRDHFRGWRRVLIAALASAAHSEGVRLLAIPAAASVARASIVPAGHLVPARWLALYDRTASEFGMTAHHHHEGLDIETVWYRAPALCHEFFVGETEKLAMPLAKRFDLVG
jgi:hypothetical protein